MYDWAIISPWKPTDDELLALWFEGGCGSDYVLEVGEYAICALDDFSDWTLFRLNSQYSTVDHYDPDFRMSIFPKSLLDLKAFIRTLTPHEGYDE